VDCVKTGALLVNTTVNSAEYKVDNIRDLSIDRLMKLNTEDLLILALSQSKLTGLEIELLNRLEQFLSMHGDYLEETHH
jgi:hypothetical protein